MIVPRSWRPLGFPVTRYYDNYGDAPHAEPRVKCRLCLSPTDLVLRGENFYCWWHR